MVSGLRGSSLSNITILYTTWHVEMTELDSLWGSDKALSPLISMAHARLANWAKNINQSASISLLELGPYLKLLLTMSSSLPQFSTKKSITCHNSQIPMWSLSQNVIGWFMSAKSFRVQCFGSRRRLKFSHHITVLSIWNGVLVVLTISCWESQPIYMEDIVTGE